MSEASGLVDLDVAAIVRRNSGRVGWPTVLLCAGLVASYGAVIVGWSLGAVPLWAGCAINAVLSYAFYTVHHDANHKSISGRNTRWLWLDTLCGSIAAIPLQLSFAGFSAEHLRHHAHTNDPRRDPDALVAGPLWALPLKWLLGTVLGVLLVLPGSERLVGALRMRLVRGEESAATEPVPPNPRIEQENRRLRRYSRICFAVLFTSIPLGVFVPVFFLWWLPGRLGILALIVLFQWLPHFPHESTERFRNTRVTTFRGSTWFLLQQDRHLIHHLYPSVPWFRYRAVFRELRPLLRAEGAIIEGRDADPPRRIQLRA
jgi:fatty acid desaturase